MPARAEALELGDRYHDRLAQLIENVARLVVGRFDAAAALQEELGASLKRFVVEGAALIALGQAQAATLSRAYVRALYRIELGEIPEEPVALEQNAGFTADGRRLTEGLSATPAKVLHALKLGRPIEQAVSFGRFAAARFAQTEVGDGARLELGHQIREADTIKGWRWRSRGTCGACVSLDDGDVRDPDEPMETHPFCQCIQEPALAVEEEVSRPTGHERFRELTPAAQAAAIGTKPAQLLREGRISWSDLFVVQQSREWRSVMTARPVEELEAIASSS